MNTNINSYDILSIYYDKIYNYQKSNKSTDEIEMFINDLVNQVDNKHNFLDVGCGTGIYTNIICKSFNKSMGIDPCEAMIQKCKNKNIEFRCMFLYELSRDKYNFISAFSQIINHLSNIKLLEEFIKNVSSRLEDNGIFYFDIFNYDFFVNNEPLNEIRPLSEKIKYMIFPKIHNKTENYMNLILNNKIIDEGKTYPYRLSMHIWSLNIIENLCNKYNIKIIEKCKMFDLSNKNLLECPKLSIICQKAHNIQ